jgi:CRP/FNR family transcriptional regulator, anaerobic regulatory protein
MLFQKLRKHISQYVEISDTEFDTISKTFKVVRYQAKNNILKKGQVLDFMAFVNEGCLENATKIGKKEQTINFSTEGCWIGDIKGLLKNNPSNISIKALESTELFVLDKPYFLESIKTNPKFLFYFLIIVYEAYLQTNEQYAKTLALSAEERYDELMENAPDFINRIPDKYLASYLGVQPPSLSRIKRKKIKKNSTIIPE